MEDIAAFLGSHPPFDGLDGDELARVAAVTDVETFPPGERIFSQGTGPVEYLRIVRTGSVEILNDGQVLDLLGPGELFGHASMLSGLPTGFEARAAEYTSCCRIPAAVIGPLLASPDFLRFIARSIVGDRAKAGPERSLRPDPVQRRVETLIRTPPVLCSAGEPIREAAKRMTAEGASAALVPAGEALGIVTDRDLRSRVVAAGVSADAPLATIMTSPAYTVRADALSSEVLLDMLDRGIHHVPVRSTAGEVLGVVDHTDLIAAEARKPFLLRRAIDLATTPTDLASAAAGLTPMIIALHDARVAAEQIAAIRSVVLDALTRRLIDLAIRDVGDPPAAFTFFALGSLGRRETVPSSDVDSALAWQDEGAGPEAAAYLARVASAVDSGLKACGVQPDAHGTSAANPLFARSVASWRAAAQSLSENPTRDKAIILVSILTDSRPLWGSGAGTSLASGPDGGISVADALWQERNRPDLLRLLARFALQFRPPTGFLRDFVVEHSGERRGQLDIKHGGLTPIIDLARWAGTLDGPDARTLMEAFGFIFSLRLDHQVEQLRRGEPPDDFIDPKTLNPLPRSYLREAFRAVASVQSGIAAELSLGIRWG